MQSELQYGSIIRLISNNDDYKDKLFFIEYIGQEELVLLDNKNFDTIQFKIAENRLDDENIERLEVLYKPPIGVGYAKLNGLAQGVIVDVF